MVSKDPYEGAVDLDAIQADDKMIDQVGAGQHTEGSDPVIPLLEAWRRECREAPFSPLDGESLDVVMARWRRRQWWRRVAQRVTFGWWPR